MHRGTENGGAGAVLRDLGWEAFPVSSPEVPMELFLRHLGLPSCAGLDEAMSALANAARSWYRAEGEPWVSVITKDVVRIDGEEIELSGGPTLRSGLLASGFRKTEAGAVALIAASAGGRVDDEIDRRWKDGRPDEAMFLNAWAVSVTEHLRERAASRIAGACAGRGLLALPHYSPGYDGWGLHDQSALFGALGDRGPLRLLESGELRPLRSTLAVVGITARREPGDRLEGMWLHRPGDAPADARGTSADYAFPERALSKWSRERLAVAALPEERVRTRFRFDGTTCSSLGRRLAFDYDVELVRDAARGWRIVRCSARPAEGDTGFRSMCAFLADPEVFDRTMRAPPPLEGRSLDEALAWNPAVSSSGCLCLRGNRNHKWRMVLETVHYRLSRAEHAGEQDAGEKESHAT